MGKKIEEFTNQYKLQKTLRFKLIPQGKTKDNFEESGLLNAEEKRAVEYGEVKKIIDRYHIDFIDRILKGICKQELSEQEGAAHPMLDNVLAYAELYRNASRTPDESKKMTELAKKMREFISKAFTKDERYKGMSKEEMISDPAYLPGFVTEEKEKEMVANFKGFTTYFQGFYENRKNMYTHEDKATGIAFRIVGQNLPRFLDNCRAGHTVLEKLPAENIEELTDAVGAKLHIDPREIFEDRFFLRVLAQSGIDDYNQMLGGYSEADGTKQKGINEYINLYNQQTGEKLPKLKPLYKQILSDRSSLSFLPEKLENDTAVLNAISAFWTPAAQANSIGGREVVEKLENLLCSLRDYDQSGIYMTAGKAINKMSQEMFDSWRAIQEEMEKKYDEEKKPRKVDEKYLKKRGEYFRKIKSWSLKEFQACIPTGEDSKDIITHISNRTGELTKAIADSYEKAKSLLENPYPAESKLIRDDKAIEQIKTFLDSVMDFKHFADALLGSGDEGDKDDTFYGEYSPLCEKLNSIIPLYNQVRNYMTQKPYSNEKIKLNFDNPQFLGGWDRNKETDYSCVLLRRDGKYYLAVMSKKGKKAFEAIPEPVSDEPVYQKMVYKLLPGPYKMLPKVFFSQKGMKEFSPPDEIYKIYKEGTYKKGENFSLSDCHKLIDFFKTGIAQHEDWCQFQFHFSDTNSYSTIQDFYKEVQEQGYFLKTVPVPVSYVDSLVETGAVYLFQLYNKDFSRHSKGTPNLHTLYFKMLFDESNLADVCYQLNGEAEMFYRKASLKRENTTIHPAGKPIANKNPDNGKPQSVFAYDIIKDRRYTEQQFELHLPITLNFKANDDGNKAKAFNDKVRQVLREDEDTYVIGIDRGERNLLYVCVIDGKGKIVEQYSLNRIINEYNGKEHSTDYHRLLAEREKERDESRKNWKTIENIKDLKEGYLSQVVHLICQLVVKYDAVIAMENLNFGFKSGRSKVEKAVYQKFEKMLIDKLSFLADKKKAPEEPGGLLNAYQLVTKFESFAKMGKQNGFIFYIPAWMTSKIDPTTGFTDQLHPGYKSMEEAKDFLNKLDCFCYDDAEKCYMFHVDYGNFPRASIDPQKHWDIYTRGTRIHTFRNKEKNNEWDSEEINLTEAFTDLFRDYDIKASTDDMRQAMIAVDEKEFYVRLLKLLSLTLQMRNSKTGTEIDYMISPVKNAEGSFYDSRKYRGTDAALPVDADANGAYHIARKAQLVIERIQACDEDKIDKVSLAVSNADWLAYIQKGEI